MNIDTSTTQALDIALLTKENADAFLQEALKLDLMQWNPSISKMEISQDSVTKQRELIKAAITHGANLKSHLDKTYSLSIETLSAQKDLLLTTDTANEFLKIVLSCYITEYNSKTSKLEVSQDKSALQRQLIEAAVGHGANLKSRLDKTYSLSIETLVAQKDLLLTIDTANEFLKLVLSCYIMEWDSKISKSEVSQDKSALQRQLIEAAVDQGANLKSYLDKKYGISIEVLVAQKDLLLTDDTANEFLKLSLAYDITEYNSKTTKSEVSQDKLALQRQLIEAAIDQGSNINALDLDSIGYQINPTALAAHKEFLFTHPTHPITAENLLRIAIKLSKVRVYNSEGVLEVDQDKVFCLNEVKKYAIEQGADLNDLFDKIDRDNHNALTILEEMLRQQDLDSIEIALNLNDGNHNYKISAMGYCAMLLSFDIAFIASVLRKIPNNFSAQEIYDTLRALGASHSLVHTIVDLYNLTTDFVNADIKESHHILSNVELSLLDKTKEALPVESYLNKDNISNPYGFSALSLALLGQKLDVAIQMIEAGFDLVDRSNNGLTPVLIATSVMDKLSKEEVSKLSSVIIKNLSNVDILLTPQGESLVDSFLNNEHLRDEIIERSNDPLFSFFKKDTDLLSLNNPNKTYIAISKSEHSWSTGVESWSRLITQKYPEVEFHLVNLEMMEIGGDDFIAQFNGWINPGAADSYPKDKREFTKKDWEQSLQLEQTYQKALDKTLQFNIPYLGMCAGAQSFVLYHEGSLYPLKGYNHGQHHVSYIAGSLPHFMAMTRDQQKSALQLCEFPNIEFKGDTAHNYAAVIDKLGHGMQLGAISEGGVAMAYAHENGLRYATQFHPEHHYHLPSDHTSTNHERAWLDNFVHLAMLHHNASVDFASTHPAELFAQIHERLIECIAAPTCSSSESFSSEVLI